MKVVFNTHKKYCCVYFTTLLLLIGIFSCKKLVLVDDPINQITTGSVFENEETAIAAISGLYIQLETTTGLGISLYGALSADEIVVTTGIDNLQLYENEIISINSNVLKLWLNAYSNIYKANSFIEGIRNSEKISAALKGQLLGEAKFIRAFNYFYLINLFGDVPYIVGTNYSINGVEPRLPVTQIYDKIKNDLLEAKGLLSADYSYSKGERVRVNKWAASALLARLFLYTGDWANAELFSSEIIDKTALYGLNANLNDVFLKNSKEAIWQLIPVSAQKYTREGGVFYQPNYSSELRTLSASLINSFEINDNRKSSWTGFATMGGNSWYYPYKYKESSSNGTGAEYSMMLRLAEQYLIRAEARAKLNKLTGVNSSASDINIIRNRAGLPSTTANTLPTLLTAIEQERKVELFTEWGHRWFDLKRNGKAKVVLSIIKPYWDDTDVLYPIPYTEIQLNPNLSQNPGY